MRNQGAFKLLLLIFLTVIITAHAAAGGGQYQGSAVTTSGKKSFSILNTSYLQGPLPPDVDVNNNKWADIFKKELPDIDINWIIVHPDQLLQRQNIMIGSGDFPDVMPMTMAQMIQWADMGIVQHVDGIYQRSYRNIYNFLTEDDLKLTKYNGHQYGISVPGNRLSNPGMMYLRKDWLDNLGLSMPRNLDELYDVLHAFTFKDPDGNGQHDTYGLAGTINFNQLWAIFHSFGVQHGANFSWVGNQLVPDFIRPEMRDAIIYLTRLYRDGIIDKDTLVMNTNQLEDKVVRGIVGMVGATASGISSRTLPNMQRANPNARIEYFLPFPAPDGNIYLPTGRNGTRMYGVSVKCTQVDAVMQFFNWMIEQDTSTLPFFNLNADKIYNGTLGIDSAPLGTKWVVEMPQNQLTPQATIDLYRFCYRTHSGTMQAVGDDLLFEITQTRIDLGLIDSIFLTAQQYTSKYGKPNGVAVMGPVYAEYMNDILTYWEETIASIISGSRPITAFDDFVRFFYANGGQRVIDEVTVMNR